jgi:type IV pilus assembly protein PilF
MKHVVFSLVYFRHLAMAGCVLTLLLLNGCASEQPINRSSFDTPGNKEEGDERRRAKIRLELAVNYFQSKQGKIALDEVNNALAADNSFPEAHILKGLILMEALQMTAADDSFKQALRLAPNDADANNTYGWFLCQSGHESQSFALFNKAAATPFYATPAKPLQNAGICATQQKNYALAESYLQRAQEQDPTLLSVSYHLAQLYLKMKDAPRANVYSNKVLMAFKPTAETLWLGIRSAHLAKDLTTQNRLSQTLKAEFITSPQWAAYLRGDFEE